MQWSAEDIDRALAMSRELRQREIDWIYALPSELTKPTIEREEAVSKEETSMGGGIQ